MDFDAIIIGGGLSGLSAGAILSRHGNRVLLLEQHYVPGGCATTFKRKDFLMEVGLHAMDGHLIEEKRNHSVLRYLGVRKYLEFIKLPEFFHIQSAGVGFTFPSGAGTAKEALAKAFPKEEPGIRKLFRLILGVQEELSRFPKTNWEKAIKFTLFPFFFPNISMAFGRTVGKYLDRNFESEELKLILQGNLLYYHDDPYTLSLLFFAKAQASFIEKGSFFIRGGSQKLSDELARVITENQGTLLLGKKVEQILVEDHKAVGVCFIDAFNQGLKKETIRAKHVIHSGALPLVTGLLEGPAKIKIERRIEGMLPACSLFCVYIGFSDELKSLGHNRYSTFIFGEGVQSLKDVHAHHTGPWEQRNIAFVNYGQIDSGLSPAGKDFGVICTADRLSDWEGLDEAEYKKRKEEAARILFGRMEELIPGITGIIETYEVATARTIKRYTMNPFGAPYGFAQTPIQSGYKRPGYRSPVKHLWLAGTWTFPGGGFTGAIVSGFLCGLQVGKQLEKVKGSKNEAQFSDEREVELLQNTALNANTLELVFQKPPGFNFQAGQYAYVSLQNPACKNADIPVRPLSISSHPSEGHLKFIMRNSNSSFKKSCEALKPGNKAIIYGPLGAFTLKPHSAGIVFLVSGIGISPVIPMLRELELHNYKGPVYLFYSNKNEDRAAFHNQLNHTGLVNYRYVPVFTGSEERINIQSLENNISNVKELDYYIVGSSGFLNSMIELLKTNGIAASHIFTDDFG